jgi:hypothetical protein
VGGYEGDGYNCTGQCTMRMLDSFVPRSSWLYVGRQYGTGEISHYPRTQTRRNSLNLTLWLLEYTTITHEPFSSYTHAQKALTYLRLCARDSPHPRFLRYCDHLFSPK